MAMMEMVGKWEPMMEKALQYDQWGQLVEATDLYVAMRQDALTLLKNEASHLKSEHRHSLNCFQATLELRLKNLRHHSAQGVVLQQNKDSGPGIGHNAIAQIARIRDFLVEGEEWPVNTSGMHYDPPEHGNNSEEEDTIVQDNRGMLVPPPKLNPGQRSVRLHINDIGLKDAMDYLDPFISVSLRAPSGNQLEPEQHTPVPKHQRLPQLLPFDVSVHLNTPLDDIAPAANVFLEFKHFKPKKNKISCRCWSMLSAEELQTEGKKNIEIYAKPADYAAKTFHKHSVKPLYLSVTISHLEC
eukprot:TRINITY_DN13247_c0_g1_i1.p2 TRINITY_DN13247_c0_g1~~TRINITY_DN13247_c0_g1_i1.p2  ORF type:complete len:326 (+),score=158.99 TRINITY_DN13247_c0_g1_i1:83-979(+)